MRRDRMKFQKVIHPELLPYPIAQTGDGKIIWVLPWSTLTAGEFKLIDAERAMRSTMPWPKDCLYTRALLGLGHEGYNGGNYDDADF